MSSSNNKNIIYQIESGKELYRRATLKFVFVKTLFSKVLTYYIYFEDYLIYYLFIFS